MRCRSISAFFSTFAISSFSWRRISASCTFTSPSFSTWRMRTASVITCCCITFAWMSYDLSACACCRLTISRYCAFLISRSRCASACAASDSASASTRSWSACALATAAARIASARFIAVSRSASADATSASRRMRAMSGRPMFVMYSFLSRTSLMVKEMTSSPILLMSSAHVARMRSPTISGSFTVCSTESCPMMPRRCPSITKRISPSRAASDLVKNCSAAV